MTDFIPIFSSLWTINPPVNKERQKCIALYKQLDLLLEKSNDTHIIVKTIMKTRSCDHILEVGDMSILRSGFIDSIRHNQNPIRYVASSLDPWKKIFHKQVGTVLFNNMFISEFLLYKTKKLIISEKI